MEYIVRFKLEVESIEPERPWSKFYGTAYGSGVFVSPTEILTNYHVMQGHVVVEIIHAHTRTNLTFIRVKKYSQILDLALVEVREVQKSFIELGNTPDIGDFLTGYGFGGGDNTNPRKTEGIVSRISFVYIQISGMQLNIIETQMHIMPGDSGSPAINSEGKLVGIRSAGSSDNVYYFIPTFMIHLFLHKNNQDVDEYLGYCGIEISSHDNIVKASVHEDIKVGDIIESLDNLPIVRGSISYSHIIEEIEGKPSLQTSYTPIYSHILCKEPNTKVIFTLIRDKKRLSVPIILEKIIDYYPNPKIVKVKTTYFANFSFNISRYLYANNMFEELHNIYSSYVIHKRTLPIIMETDVLPKEFIYCPVVSPNKIDDIKSSLIIYYKGVNIEIQI